MYERNRESMYEFNSSEVKDHSFKKFALFSFLLLLCVVTVYVLQTIGYLPLNPTK